MCFSFIVLYADRSMKPAELNRHTIENAVSIQSSGCGGRDGSGCWPRWFWSPWFCTEDKTYTNVNISHFYASILTIFELDTFFTSVSSISSVLQVERDPLHLVI